MGIKWKDVAHLVRPALVFAVGVGGFLVLRSVLVPPTFGQYGHYRGASLGEIRQLPMKYAGQARCAECHTEQVQLRTAGKHRDVACEACHGPAIEHVANFTTHKPAIPDVPALCSRCHEADAAKPAWFKQVDTKQHNAGVGCAVCHQPHQPHP